MNYYYEDLIGEIVKLHRLAGINNPRVFTTEGTAPNTQYSVCLSMALDNDLGVHVPPFSEEHLKQLKGVIMESSCRSSVIELRQCANYTIVIQKFCV